MARYRASMRRSRIVYFAIVGAIVVALGTWVAVEWSRGEAAHASLHTFSPAPPALGLAAPSPQPIESWRTSDQLAIGTPQVGGTVITYSKHSVGGRDARTGQRTWVYTRTDRSVCIAAQLATQPDGTTVAVYNHNGNCDEVSAFNSGTGRRLWTRTLDEDGMPLDGRPTFQVLPYTFLAASSSVIYAIDPGTGYNRWTYQRHGCAIKHVVLGTGGALISQDCSATVVCKGVKFCARGPQLLLRDGSAGDQNDKPNGDQIKWLRVGDSSIPVSADGVIISMGPLGRTLYVNNAGSGDRTHHLALVPGTSATGTIAVTGTNNAEVVWISGETYAIRVDSDKPSWQVSTQSPPTVVSTVNEGTVSLSSARITAVIGPGIGLIDGTDGKITQQFTVPTPADGSVVYPLGTGFLVGSPRGTIAYR
jgi:outer membrane protein assembly factor BamB